jgi:hypothetical protein
MTSVLAPQGVGLWGQNLRFTGAVGVAPAIPSDAYNRNSIGQRGGSVVTPIADVVGAGPSSSSRDPFNKQAATLIIRDEPKPRTLRDGFSGGEASFERGGIVTPIARTTLTEPEIKARLGSEGKSTRPASATPISLNDAIAMLRTAEETWPDTSTANDDDEEHAINTGYTELVSDAKRLKIIKGASMRRPITDEEQTVVTQIASKYASALGELSSDAVGVEAAAAAEDARPANQAASLAAAAEQVNKSITAAEADITKGENDLRIEAARVDGIENDMRTLMTTYDRLAYNRRNARAAGHRQLANNITNKLDKLDIQGDMLNAERDASIARQGSLDNLIYNTVLARDALDQQADDLINTRVEPSRSEQMRAESTARFAPHDRERAQQAATMRGVMDPQFLRSRAQAERIGENASQQRQAQLSASYATALNSDALQSAIATGASQQRQAAMAQSDAASLAQMSASYATALKSDALQSAIATGASQQRNNAILQAALIGSDAYGQRALIGSDAYRQRANAMRAVEKNTLAQMRQSGAASIAQMGQAQTLAADQAKRDGLLWTQARDNDQDQRARDTAIQKMENKRSSSQIKAVQDASLAAGQFNDAQIVAIQTASANIANATRVSASGVSDAIGALTTALNSQGAGAVASINAATQAIAELAASGVTGDTLMLRTEDIITAIEAGAISSNKVNSNSSAVLANSIRALGITLNEDASSRELDAETRLTEMLNPMSENIADIRQSSGGIMRSLGVVASALTDPENPISVDLRGARNVGQFGNAANAPLRMRLLGDEGGFVGEPPREPRQQPRRRR